MSAPVVTAPPRKPSVLGGIRPDLTPAQLLSGVPVICALLASFGVWDPTEEQQQALEAAVLWAAALVLGDAGLRAGRSLAHSRVESTEVAVEAQAAAMPPPIATPPPGPPPGVPPSEVAKKLYPDQPRGG